MTVKELTKILRSEASNQLSNFPKRYFHQKTSDEGMMRLFPLFYRQSECLIISTSCARLESPLYPPPPPRSVMRVIPACPASKWSCHFPSSSLDTSSLKEVSSTPANTGKNNYLPPSNLHSLFYWVCHMKVWILY
jgi:hypothetical protein